MLRTLARAMTMEKKLMKPIVNHSGLVKAAVLPNTEACIHKYVLNSQTLHEL